MANTSSNDEPLNITDDLIEATPIEKCSLNPRRGKNSRRLLTGFIIFASEARKEVADQYPNENFGFISRLVGDKWRALSSDVKFKYHKRALIHNRRIKDLAQKEGITLGAVDLLNGSHDLSAKIGNEGSNTPKKLSKKKQAKLAKQERKRLENESSNYDRSSTSQTPTEFNNAASGSNSSFVDPSHQYQHQQQQYQQQQQQLHQPRPSKRCADSGTQTPSVKYIDPPSKKPLTYSEAFLKRLLDLFSDKQVVEQMDTTGAATIPAVNNHSN